MKMTESYAYSTNGEAFQGDYPSREAALAEAREYGEGDVWTGRAQPVSLSGLASDHATSIVEQMNDWLCDQVGSDVAEDQPDASDDDIKQLDEQLRPVIEKWLEGRVNCFKVVDIERHPASD